MCFRYADLRSEWAGASADVDWRGGTETLTILGAPVMEDWEAPYMEALAAVACKNGGRVLEVGFGLGLSAKYIDAHDGVTEHVIVEANAEVAAAARLFAEETATKKTTIIEAFWQDAVAATSPPLLEGGSFDGILFDVFPLSKKEVVDGECDSFYPAAARLLKSGGRFTFYFDGTVVLVVDVRCTQPTTHNPQRNAVHFRYRNAVLVLSATPCG